MLTSQIKNDQKYNYLDYKQPVNALANDLRTATFLGHRYYRQNDSIIPPAKSLIPPCYTLHQKEIRYDYTSEAAGQYTPKYDFNKTNKAHLNICCSKPTFARSMEHRIFRRTPKPLTISSSHSRDYGQRPQTDKDYLILNRMSCVGELSRTDPGTYGDDVDVDGCYK